MRYEYSVINDLYGTEAARPKPRQQGSLGFLILLALAGIFLYESVHPVMRLRSEPPPSFLNVKSPRQAKLSQSQENVARVYWNVAAGTVSERYSYGQMLPSKPPEDFTISQTDDYATRALYWQRLRGLWNQQETWVTSYQFDTAWADNVLVSAGNIVKNYLDA
jgi:hypothetical protein